LIANDSETTFVSRQRLGKHLPAATDTHATIEVLLEMVFSIRSVERGYKKNNWGNRISLVGESVKKRVQLEGAVVQRGLEPGGRGITIVRIRCQGTTSEDTAGWKRLSGCCGDL
jgi:hypothetical protein